MMETAKDVNRDLGATVLETAGMGAVLLVPLVLEGTTVALLEVYRRAPQPWTNTQADRARVLADHIAAGLARVTIRSRGRAGSFPLDERRPPRRPAARR